MKDRIIRESIRCLQKEGLKFSVDTLAETLKISKKTVYKYFPNKEALALAMYTQYYREINERAISLLQSGGDTVLLDLLLLYYDAKMMIRREIFNKYNLNETIYAYAKAQNERLWCSVSAFLSERRPDDAVEVLRVIIDGTLEHLCETPHSPETVIQRLVYMI